MEFVLLEPVNILCSGFGLGFYIPGLMIRDGLRAAACAAEVEVFEALMLPEKLNMVEKNRRAYQENFRVAIASQRVPMDVRLSINPVTFDSLLERWKRNNLRNFVALSGHWVYVLDRYREENPNLRVSTQLLQLDADLAPSWKQLAKFRAGYETDYTAVALYSREPAQVQFAIATPNPVVVPWAERSQSLLVHGGGWGLGDYTTRIDQLQDQGFCLKVVGASRSDAYPLGSSQFFLDDPSWRTWHRDRSGECTYPPFAQLPSGAEDPLFSIPVGESGVHAIARDSTAIVSKPGAGTLIDSLSCATPLVMLQPFGLHERANAELWERLGFGIRFETWARVDFRREELTRLHENLTYAKQNTPDYVKFLQTSL